MALALFMVCLLLILIVLLQKGRGGGLTAAFGGGGGGGAFGAKTGDVFTGITVVLAFVFLLLTVIGNYVFQPPKPPPRAALIQGQPAGAQLPAGQPGAIPPVRSAGQNPAPLPVGPAQPPAEEAQPAETDPVEPSNVSDASDDAPADAAPPEDVEESPPESPES